MNMRDYLTLYLDVLYCSHSRVYNNKPISYLKISVKRPPPCKQNNIIQSSLNRKVA